MHSRDSDCLVNPSTGDGAAVGGERVYRIVNDDDPMDVDFPAEVTLTGFVALGEDDVTVAVRGLAVGESVTVGGGAAVQFTITRVR